MVPILSLWLPILLSAVAVFILSSIIHMVLGYHKNDFSTLPNEKQVLDDLRKHNLPEGDYSFPRPNNMKDMKSPEFIEKMKQGPVGMMTISKNGSPNMGKELSLWFIYSIIVGIFAAYVAGRALPQGAHYLQVFRFAGVTAFVGYSLALLQGSIWYKRSWSATFKSMFDGLIYALFTAGFFGWLWPGV
ncbi:MAG: hypothetical protein OQK52_01600 [Ignavibacteriaceae bacterium]|nr:hypothetical protein [Ignavibacteriaceae bacterium]MCW8816551.1 hypothetical protein [Ignavibacteriaceae bacterium]